MRIVDEESDNTLNSIILMLTPAEKHELVGKLQAIDPKAGDHIHINDDNFSREITILIYTPDNVKFFSQKVREVIEKE